LFVVLIPAAAFLIAWAATAISCWFVVGFRQLLTRRLLSARPNKTCFCTGVVFGVCDAIVMFALIYLEPMFGRFDQRWLWSGPLVGPLIASIVLVRPAVRRD
jgi:hypothetical protein